MSQSRENLLKECIWWSISSALVNLYHEFANVYSRFYYNFPELGRFTIIMRRKSRVLRRLEEGSSAEFFQLTFSAAPDRLLYEIADDYALDGFFLGTISLILID